MPSRGLLYNVEPQALDCFVAKEAFFITKILFHHYQKKKCLISSLSNKVLH